jgi:hypothetical protein
VRGTVGVLTGGGAPIDELGTWLEGLPSGVEVRKVRGNQIPYQRNKLVSEMVGGWLCFVDADCVPPPGALEQLLDRNVGVVGGVILERRDPFQVCATRSLEPFERYLRSEIPARGLFPVVAIGTGFVLIRREVFEALGARHWFRAGQIPGAPDLLAEDLDFCLRAAAVGFPSYMDCGVRVKHEIHGLVSLGDDGEIWAQWDGPDGARLPYAEPVYLGGAPTPLGNAPTGGLTR